MYIYRNCIFMNISIVIYDVIHINLYQSISIYIFDNMNILIYIDNV